MHRFPRPEEKWKGMRNRGRPQQLRSCVQYARIFRNSYASLIHVQRTACTSRAANTAISKDGGRTGVRVYLHAVFI